jgi:ribosomal-protein-alanine N-acetyltransferase
MSAVLKHEPRFSPMRESEIAEVLAIENAIYTHPWTRGNFADSLKAGYQCWTWRAGAELIGYFIVLVAAGEAHLLNLSVAAARQRVGHGSMLLTEAMRLARMRGAAHIFLEVRPSNDGAKALYRRFGFRQVAVRPGYYPARGGREDALVLTLAL